jgi:putative ABC transport system permease protein
MLKIHFKIAWRNITSHKTSTLVNILGLALGIASCLVIYLIAHFELSYDNFHPGKENIYRIVTDMNSPRGQDHASNVPAAAPIAIRNELAGMQDLAIFNNYYANVTIREDSTVLRRFPIPNFREKSSDIIIAEPTYFDIFQYRWLAGNPATALKEPFKVVLTESNARTYFGQRPLQDIINRTIIYNDSLTVAVSGIVKDFPVNTDFYFNDFISFSTASHSFLKDEFSSGGWTGGSTATQIFVKLHKGTTAASIDNRLVGLVQKHLPDGGGRKTF